MPDYSDQHLVERALAGDEHAFRLLVERYQRFVYRLAYRFVGTVGEAEDITQESFVKLWRNLHRYRSEIRLTTWLYKIVVNMCLDFLKSAEHRRTKRTVELMDRYETNTALPADQPLIDEELRIAVGRLTDKLSPKQKAVFVLRDLEEVSMPEIAEILSMDPGQVKSNLYYARRKISALIELHYKEGKEEKP